jgi:TetR/AcrR family transcriptional repressor of nem operon
MIHAKHGKLIIAMNSAIRILDIAERRMRSSGYNAVSYRDIAAEIGIKSASLHYHFPKKENLGVALVRRYSENFRSELNRKTEHASGAKEKVTAFIDIYRYAVEEQRLVCLCAVLGAESPGLPHLVSVELKAFFEANIAWLTEQFIASDNKLSDMAASHRAKTVLSMLQGAMIISSVNDDMSVFDSAVSVIQETLL